MAYPTVDFPILPGAREGTGNDDTLYLQMFSGEVLAAFREKNVMMPLHKVVNVGAGKSFQFPVIGKADTSYHVRGESLLDGAQGYLSPIKHDDRTINVDKLLISSAFIDNWDEKIKHFESRSEYSYQLGAALARKMDQQLLQLIALTGREGEQFTADSLNSGRAGLQISASGVSTSAATMATALRDAAANFAEKDVPMNELWFCVRPAMYFRLVEQGDFINRDYNPQENGSRAMGKLVHAMGFNVIWSNNIPSTDLTGTADAGEKNTYVADFRETVAVGWHRDAIGTVLRDGIATEQDYQVERQGTLVASKVLAGHGILRPECAVEVIDPDIVP